MVDAARRELIGSVRFRRWKWCSTNTGSNPVLTTKQLERMWVRLPPGLSGEDGPVVEREQYTLIIKNNVSNVQ